jgi:hypothetical protein
LLWVGGNRLGQGRKWQGWISAQWAATLGSAPVLLVVFGQLPLVSPLANAFAIPLVSIGVTPLTLAGLFDPSGILLFLAERLYAVTDYLLLWCTRLPASLWNITPPPLWALAPAALGVLLALAPRGVPGRLLGGVLLSSSPPPHAVTPNPASTAVPTEPTPPRSKPRRDRRAPSTDSNVGLAEVLAFSLLKSTAVAGASIRCVMGFLAVGVRFTKPVERRKAT